MKAILSFSRLLLLPCALLLNTSCDLPGDEQIVDPNAEAEYRKPGVPVEDAIPPYSGAPGPKRAPSVAKNPDVFGDIIDQGIEEVVVNRGPEILDTIIGNREDAEMIRSVLEQAPAVIEEILNRTNGGTEIPPEVIDEARHIIAQNAPVVMDEIIHDSGADHPITRVIGEFILQRILESLDSGGGTHPPHQHVY